MINIEKTNAEYNNVKMCFIEVCCRGTFSISLKFPHGIPLNRNVEPFVFTEEFVQCIAITQARYRSLATILLISSRFVYN